MIGSAANGSPVGAAELDAAKLLLSRMGIDPADLLTVPGPEKVMPTFGEYIPVVAAAVSVGTRRSYASYWDKIERRWGARRLDEPTPTEIKQLAEEVKSGAVVRSNSRGGRNAAENLIAAVRCLYRHAQNDNLISEADNPAIKVEKPRRLPSLRRSLTSVELSEITHAGSTTGDDPELDALLIRLHVETACRRQGALNLRLQDLGSRKCLIYLHEKGDTTRWQPVSPTLMAALVAHARDRGATDKSDQLLRYRSGRPITRRRYDHLWNRIGRYLPWVAAQNISTHWLRHTTLTWVERNFGYAIAQAYAGHTDSTSLNHGGTTATYIKANIHDIATALSTLTNQPHPLTATPEFVVADPGIAC